MNIHIETRSNKPRIINSDMVKMVNTFKKQHPEYENDDVHVEVTEGDAVRKYAIRAKNDPAFCVTYYAQKPVTEESEGE